MSHFVFIVKIIWNDVLLVAVLLVLIRITTIPKGCFHLDLEYCIAV